MSDLISYQLEDGIATLTLSNGKVNAISPDVIAAFNAALDRAEQDLSLIHISMCISDRPRIMHKSANTPWCCSPSSSALSC